MGKNDNESHQRDEHNHMNHINTMGINHIDSGKHEPHQHHNHSEMNHDHKGHSGHGGHAGHHAYMIGDFKKRFWVSLIFSIPISLLSSMIQMLFGYEIHFSGDSLELFILSTFVFFYGGKPFLQGRYFKIHYYCSEKRIVNT